MSKFRDPIWRATDMRWFRVATAGALLLVDVRLFYLYAFVTLLRTWEAVDHVRATMRVFQVTADMRWLVLLDKVRVNADDINVVVEYLRDETPDYNLNSIAKDWSASTGQPIDTDELFKTARANDSSFLPKNQRDREFRDRLRATMEAGESTDGHLHAT